MMLHPGLETLQALSSDDLAPDKRLQITNHLGACARCQRETDWIERVRTQASALAALPAPAESWSTIRERIERGDRVILPTSDQSASEVPARRRLAIAAVLALLLGGSAAGLAYLDNLSEWLRNGETVRARDQPAAPPTTAPLTDPVSFIVAVQDGRLDIAIVAPNPDLRLRVRLSAGADLEVTALGAAAGARFRSGPGRLTVEESGTGELILAVPRTAHRVTVQVDGRPLWTMESGQVRVLVRADTSGAEFILPVR